MKPNLTIRFWGVRGSIPSPCSSTVRYGGNTSCVSVEKGEDNVLVFDAGTGIRSLGKFLAGKGSRIFVLPSHGHSDHIQGFPFFAPIYESNRTIFMCAAPQGKDMICSLIEQMDGASFPVPPDELPSKPECITEDIPLFLQRHGFNVTRIACNHPGNAYGYRLDDDRGSIVYLTDNELDPPYARANDFEDFVRFCKNADVLIHDAQYVEQDMPHKHGWGHSLVSQACSLGAAAGVKHLLLYHHDPDRNDDALDTIERNARSWFQENHPETRCTVAAEGLTLEL
jgi:phosphoribosyl 1,2-cyclic phosphodiesterase